VNILTTYTVTYFDVSGYAFERTNYELVFAKQSHAEAYFNINLGKKRHGQLVSSIRVVAVSSRKLPDVIQEPAYVAKDVSDASPKQLLLGGF